MVNHYRLGAVDAILSGPPGSGKTYTIGEIVRQFRSQNKSVAVTASTNKAVDVVKEAAISDGWYHMVHSFSTVHKILGLVYDPVENRCEQLGFNRAYDVDVVIVDEASMLQEDLVKELRTYSRFVIFVGDKNQLPPVGEDTPAAFKIQGSELKESHRHNNNEDLRSLISFVESAISDDIDKIPNHLIEPFIMRDLLSWQDQIGISHDEIALAWTNAEVDRINHVVRNKQGYDDEYVVGERIIFKAPVYDSAKHLIFSTSQIATIQEVSRTTIRGFPCFNLRVLSKTTQSYILVYNTMYNDEISWLEEQGNRPPVTARIKYANAITIHGSQGSEWDKVSVNLNDIRRCIDIDIRRRLLYVAFSRPKNILKILSMEE